MSIRTAVLTVVIPLLAAGCGGGDSAAETTTAAAQSGESSTQPAETDLASTVDGAFPVTVEHKYGSTTLDEVPVRVVSIGYGEHDGLLALGVEPIAVREWYGDYPYAAWPWAQDELGDAQPEVLAGDALNFEQIAALRPDIIMGIASGMTDTDYETLSAIAPTIAQPDEFIDYGTPWDLSLEITGRALGRSAEAEQVIADTEQLFADARAAHPEFEGASAAVTFFFEEQPGAYASEDVRSRALRDLGFVIPAAIDEAAGDAFFINVSAEDLSLIDTDVVVWIVGSDEGITDIVDIATRPSMRAYTEGREILGDSLVSGAFSHSSPLSLEYVIEALVPELAAAVDGDPSTIVPSAQQWGLTASSTTPTADSALVDDDEAMVADVWRSVFDSATAFEDRAPNLEDADALRQTAEAYATFGDGLGGVSLEPTAVVVDGDVATVTYDVLFGGTAAYTDQTGTVERVNGVWTVGRDQFCSFMVSARQSCPAG
jgi:iron complex transport system substrate-binding protein